MQKEENKFCDSTVFEGMVSIRCLLEGAKDKTNDRKIKRILYAKERLSKIGKEVAFLRHEGERSGFTVEEMTENELSALTLGTSHGGLLAECTDRTLPSLSALSLPEKGFYVMLEGIEDPYNFGYCLRSLYAAGVDGILVGPRNWFSAAGVVCRSSAGASELFEIAEGDTVEIVRIFKEKGYTVLAADKTDDAVSIYDREVKTPVLLVVGGEKRGITRAVLSECDGVVCLDYGRRFGAALSAASAASILAFEIFRQNREENGEV